MRCPKICFKENASLFENIPDPQSVKPFSTNEENGVTNSTKNMTKNQALSGGNTKNAYKSKFLKFQPHKNKKNEISVTESLSSNNNSSDEENKIKDKIMTKEEDTSSNCLERNSNNMRDSLVEGNSPKNKRMSTKNSFNNFNARPSKIIQTEKQLRPKFYFKTKDGKENKFIKFNKNFVNNDTVTKTLTPYSIEDNFPEVGNKIAIPSDDLRKEIFIFDPILIDLNKGSLNTFVFEEILKKRARLLFPYRQNFIKVIIIKLLQFLFIIKSKIANKKNMKNANQLTNNKKKNGKTKLKEIEGSNIITFSDVKPFMKSKFGHFNLEVFKNAYEKKLQKNEEIKKAKKMAELQRKFLDILQKEDIEHQGNEDDENLKNEKRRNDANPLDIEKDSKMLRGAVYKPRKKMNYLNGLKMLIKEEASKNKGSNFKYQ